MNNEKSFSPLDKLASITDDYMKEKLSQAKPYTAVILKKGPAYHNADASSIIWEHGRRNFLLREEGLLPIVCRVNDGSGYRDFYCRSGANKIHFRR